MTSFKLDSDSVNHAVSSMNQPLHDFQDEQHRFGSVLRPFTPDPVSTGSATVLEKYRLAVVAESQRAYVALNNASTGLKSAAAQILQTDEDRKAHITAAFHGLPTSGSDSQFRLGELTPMPESNHDAIVSFERGDANSVKKLLHLLESSNPQIAQAWQDIADSHHTTIDSHIKEINEHLSKSQGKVFDTLRERLENYQKFCAQHYHDVSVLKNTVLETKTAFTVLKESVPSLAEYETCENRVKDLKKQAAIKPDDSSIQSELQAEQQKLDAMVQRTHAHYTTYANQALTTLPTPTTTPEIIGAGGGSSAGGSADKDDTNSGKDTDRDKQPQTPADSGAQQAGQGGGQGGGQPAGGGAPQGGGQGAGQGGGAPAGGEDSKDDDKDSDDKDKDKDDDGKDSKHHHGLPGTHAASAHDKHAAHGGGGGAGGSATPLSKASVPGAGGASGTQPGVQAPGTAAAAASGGQTGPAGGPAGGMAGGARPGGSSGEKTRSNMFINKTKDDSWVDDEAFDVPIQHTGVADPNNGNHSDPGNNQQNQNQDQPPRPKFRPGQRPPRNPSE